VRVEGRRATGTQGKAFINRFDDNSYIYITRALDQFDLATRVRLAEAALAHGAGRGPRRGFTRGNGSPPTSQNRSKSPLALLRDGKPPGYRELSPTSATIPSSSSPRSSASSAGFLERNPPPPGFFQSVARE